MFSYVGVMVAAIAVALRKESVDRNKYVVQCRKVMGVALRKESVDRNRAERFAGFGAFMVALRKESVDRNPLVGDFGTGRQGRSPQGERG